MAQQQSALMWYTYKASLLFRPNDGVDVKNLFMREREMADHKAIFSIKSILNNKCIYINDTYRFIKNNDNNKYYSKCILIDVSTGDETTLYDEAIPESDLTDDIVKVMLCDIT